MQVSGYTPVQEPTIKPLFSGDGIREYGTTVEIWPLFRMKMV
jgi:hypothetical protein